MAPLLYDHSTMKYHRDVLILLNNFASFNFWMKNGQKNGKTC